MTSLGRIFLAVLVVATLALGASALWRFWRGRTAPPPPAAVADSTQAGMRAVTLWFADESGDSLVSDGKKGRVLTFRIRKA